MTTPTTSLISFDHTTVEDAPFRWHHVLDTFRPADAAELRGTFPRDGFRMVSRTGVDKSYAMYYRRLHPMDGGEAPPEPALPDPWRHFVAEVTGPAYRAAVAALTGLPIETASIEVNLWRYGASCWLDPHVDKPEKIVTHVLYFNESWPTGRGGDLLLLGSSSEGDVVRRVAPAANSGVLLVRGDRSWHAVERVRDGEALERLSAQVVFHQAAQEITA
ncbi:2OG-Fe(II) oxygenase superfamily protein [Sinosporangium album]|uniref:2OG-Fe(II) oxygenase superfamily protein n=1 Tax=Sinosporangium album TaxID=504805 RepID=A0A1G7QLN9_9ACTN|nr:2OG-Fe(II) oxygenase [Sinosporangium album]SDF99426.1 2OG-Fe(II) oxygenase superfamily protein [Sinosporangium album]